MNCIISCNFPYIVKQPVSPDYVAFIIHHFLIFAKDLDGRTDRCNEEVSAAHSFLPEPMEFFIQMFFEFLFYLFVETSRSALHLAGDDVDGGGEGGGFLRPHSSSHFCIQRPCTSDY